MDRLVRTLETVEANMLELFDRRMMYYYFKNVGVP